ncbi:hypothetical protein PR048_008275 [Dryococelus australis]|uniref:Uncharacterized protein n=1 Tax=Dryococelus australis TaxID=614101 RepID=A0ABQ9HWN2_9NEOP|nr:hypothetical protein PR048_008275 [Dryococelus australis]
MFTGIKEEWSADIWEALNIEVLRADEGKRAVPDKTRRTATSSGTILTYENPGAVQPRIEPGSHRWEAKREREREDSFAQPGESIASRSLVLSLWELGQPLSHFSPTSGKQLMPTGRKSCYAKIAVIAITSYGGMKVGDLVANFTSFSDVQGRQGERKREKGGGAREKSANEMERERWFEKNHHSKPTVTRADEPQAQSSALEVVGSKTAKLARVNKLLQNYQTFVRKRGDCGRKLSAVLTVLIYECVCARARVVLAVEERPGYNTRRGFPRPRGETCRTVRQGRALHVQPCTDAPLKTYPVKWCLPWQRAETKAISRINFRWLRGQTTRIQPGQTRFDTRQGYSQIFARADCAGRYRWLMGFLRDFPFPPPLHSGAAPYSPYFALIGSQDLDLGTLLCLWRWYEIRSMEHTLQTMNLGCGPRGLVGGCGGGADEEVRNCYGR